MKRIFRAMAIGTAGVLAVAAPASAAQKQVTQVRTDRIGATASWGTSMEESDQQTYIDVSRTRSGAARLIVEQSRYVYGEGGLESAVVTSADVTTGFAFSIDPTKFTWAQVSATDVPAITCVLTGSEEDADCQATTLSLKADWSGIGPLSRSANIDRFQSGGIKVVTQWRNTHRDATATATVNGTTLSPDTFGDGSLGMFRMKQTTMCPGGEDCGGGQ